MERKMLEQHYLTFKLLAQTLSYTKTAQRLFMTQPAVSQQIKRLEAEVGVPLVRYQHRQLQLTAAGDALATYLAQLTVQNDKFMEGLRQPRPAPRLLLGATMSLNTVFLPRLLPILRHQYQQIVSKIGNTAQILQQLRQGQIDFALIEGNFDKTEFDYQVIRREPFICVTGTGNPLLHDGIVYQPHELIQETLLIREPGSGSREILLDWLASFNLQLADFAQRIEIGDPQTIMTLLQQGFGISFMYASLAQSALQQQQLRQVQLPALQLDHELYLIYRKGTDETDLTQQLLKILR
jgi:DNA-binding transcriptional LysR family regulator